MKRALALAAALVCLSCGKSPRDANNCPDINDPRVSYVEGTPSDPQRCEVIRFVCVRGSVAFSSDCGCGCIRQD
jgi:hypothetical protein